MTTRRQVALSSILVAALVIVPGCMNTNDTSTRPAIVLVAFGTSVPEARETFTYIDAAARARYPDHNIRWAFTSSFIREKLARQGIVTKSLDDVVAELRTEGIGTAIFQSLHIAPGQEYREIGAVDTTGMDIAVGDALLTSDLDIADTIAAIASNIDPDAAVVIVAHGNEHHPELNAQIIAFANAIESDYPNAVVCSIEGQPGTDGLVQVASQAIDDTPVTFIPLMIVAGDHIQNDVIGNEPDSWKNRIGAGAVTCAPSLGYNDAILAIYFRHVDNAMAQLAE